MSNLTIGLALIGTGLISREHMPAIQQAAGARLAGVFDIDVGRARSVAAAYGGARVYEDLAGVLRDPEVDAVLIAVPNRYHQDVAVRAAEAGKHVLLEKPLAHDIDSARVIVDVCQRAGVTLRLAHSGRATGAAILARRLIAAGVIGPIKSFRSVFSQTWSVVSVDDYRWNLAISGGATLMDLAIHRVDLVHYLTGARYQSVAASLRHSVIPSAVDDNVHLVVEMEGPLSGTLSSDRFSPTMHDATEFYGTEGSLHLAQETTNAFHCVPLTVFTQRDPATLPAEILTLVGQPSHAGHREVADDGWHQLFPNTRSPFLTQIEAFVALLSGREPPVALATGEEGLHYLELVQAAYASQIERRWVDVPMPAGTPWHLPAYR